MSTTQTSARLRVRVNGEAREVAAGTTVAALIEHCGAPVGRVAVERNLEVVPRARHEAELLADGDVVEIVAFVGGG